MNFDYIVVVLASVAVGASVYVYLESIKLKRELAKKEKDRTRQMFEIKILKDIGDKVGYSLNVQNIVDIIFNSLGQFLEFTTVSYMILEPEKIVFKANVEHSVSRKFLDDVKSQMMESLSKTLERDIKKFPIEESVTGAMFDDTSGELVQSLFHIPIIIGGTPVGVLTVADEKAGLYKEEEMTLLHTIMDQASKAVMRLQNVVRTEQRKLSAMVGSMAEGIIMTDKEYRIQVINPAAKKMLGLEDANVSIFDVIKILGESFDFKGYLEKSLIADKVVTVNEVLIKEKYYQIFIAPVKLKADSGVDITFGGVVIFHDITLIKQAEKMRKEFSSMMVHELRSPLDGINKMTYLMLEEPSIKKDAENSENLLMVNEAASSMLELVNDLLDVGKIEAGKFEIRKEALDIRELISSKLHFFKPVADESKISIHSNFGKDVPKGIMADSTRLGQVLTNLISNALKFIPDGGNVSLGVMVHKQGADVKKEAKLAGIDWRFAGELDKVNALPDSLIITVTDNGVGISAADMKHLFEKYIQFKKAAKSSAKGTGLGLAIAKGIVASHGGVISAMSVETEGSTFYFTIPLE